MTFSLGFIAGFLVGANVGAAIAFFFCAVGRRADDGDRGTHREMLEPETPWPRGQHYIPQTGERPAGQPPMHPKN